MNTITSHSIGWYFTRRRIYGSLLTIFLSTTTTNVTTTRTKNTSFWSSSPLSSFQSSFSVSAFSTMTGVAAVTTATATTTMSEANTNTTSSSAPNNFLQSFNPATGELLGEVPIASTNDVHQAIEKAKIVQRQQWKQLSASQRADILQQAYTSAFGSNSNNIQSGLAQLLSMEMGKDLRRAGSEVSGAIRSGPYVAREAATAFQPVSKGHGQGTEYYMPLGVVGVISPWNYPIMMACNLIVPALVGGNAVILKPSEQTPLIADEFFGRIIQHLPSPYQDIFQIIHGDGTVGRTLVEGDIQMIAFTGSQATGRDIMARSASKLKRLVMELGGNDPMIVLKDANIDDAAHFAVAGGMENTGQMCTSIERVYVDERIATEFERKVQYFAKQYRVGPWNEHTTSSGTRNVNGPIINDRQHDKIVQHIEDAKSKGGRFLVGGSDEDQQKPYIRPTVIADMTRDMLLERDETFGPVIGISTFQNVQDAIDRANDSDYGLGAVVFGYDGVQDVAMELEVGMVGINQGQGGPEKWIGAKQSGFGYHGGPDGHRQFTQIKLIAN